MKKMKIEKQLIFADQVKRIVSLNVNEHLTYRHEAEGIRASGPLDIEGSYEGEAGIETFRETLEMDVLAPNNKLSGQSFALSVSDFQGKANGDSIHVMITLDIKGVRDDQADSQQTAHSDDVVAAPSQAKPQNVPITVPEPAFSAQSVNHPAARDQNVMDDRDNNATLNEDNEEMMKINDLDDIFQDAESTYTSYRIIVAKPNDTYMAIAQRYDVDEEALRETNKNKEILAKTLVILPFCNSI